MEKYQQWRDEKASELLSLSKEERKTRLGELKTSEEYTGAKNSREFEKGQRSISDQALEYFSNHHIINEVVQNKNTLPDILGLVWTKKSDNKSNERLTFERKLPQLLGHLSVGKDVLSALSFAIDGNKNYWDAKEHWRDFSESERLEYISDGPYAHGAHIQDLMGGKRSLVNTENPFICYGFGSYKFLFDFLLENIDRGEMTAPELESDFREFYHLYLDVGSRLITLAVRDPKWGVSELEDFLRERLGPEFVVAQTLFAQEEGYADLQAMFRKRTKEFNKDNLRKAIEISHLMVKTYRLIDEYFQEKVRYANE